MKELVLKLTEREQALFQVYLKSNMFISLSILLRNVFERKGFKWK